VAVRARSLEPVRERAEITRPDVVVVLDPTLLRVMNVTSGLKEKGALVINTRRTLQDIESELGTAWQLAVVDAMKIARELLGVPIVNTTMLGALLRATGVVEMESLVEPLKERFDRLADRNINAMKRAFEETVLKE